MVLKAKAETELGDTEITVSVTGDWGTVDAENAKITVVCRHEYNGPEARLCNLCGEVRKPVSIKLSQLPEKLEYSSEEDLDVSGGKIEITYDNETVAVIDLTAAMVSGFDITVDGKQTLTVTYDGKTTSYEIEMVLFQKGDTAGDGVVDSDDAIHLLYNVLFGDTSYPLSQNCDFDGSGIVDSDDAIYLLYYVLFGESSYPLH